MTTLTKFVGIGLLSVAFSTAATACPMYDQMNASTPAYMASADDVDMDVSTPADTASAETTATEVEMLPTSGEAQPKE